MNDLRLGVDLGGTKIEGVVARFATGGAAPEVLARLRVPTERALGYDHVLEAVAGLIADTLREAGLPADAALPMGVGMPGNVSDGPDGVPLVKNSNTTCLNGRPFRADLSRRLGVDRPLRFANDANCFALAEVVCGAAYGSAMTFGVIMGTGVGGGVVLGGALPRFWDGAQGIAGEWGHVTLDPQAGPPCYCGRRGCVEQYLSGPAIEAAFRARSGRTLALPDIAAAAEQGDTQAGTTLAVAAAIFGRALSMVVNILDPEVIVLGGGVSNLGVFYEKGVAVLRDYVFSDGLKTRVVRNALGDSAGVLGAAWLAGLG